MRFEREKKIIYKRKMDLEGNKGRRRDETEKDKRKN